MAKYNDPKTGKTVVGNVLVDPTQDLMALTSIGKMIRVDMGTIRKAGRNTSGVTIVNVDKGDKVVSIAMCPKENEEIELDEDGNPIKIIAEEVENNQEAGKNKEENNLLDINEEEK